MLLLALSLGCDGVCQCLRLLTEGGPGLATARFAVRMAASPAAMVSRMTKSRLSGFEAAIGKGTRGRPARRLPARPESPV